MGFTFLPQVQSSNVFCTAKISGLLATIPRKCHEVEGLPKDCDSQALTLSTKCGDRLRQAVLHGTSRQEQILSCDLGAGPESREVHIPSGVPGTVRPSFSNMAACRVTQVSYDTSQSPGPTRYHLHWNNQGWTRNQYFFPNSQDYGSAQPHMRNSTMRRAKIIVHKGKTGQGICFPPLPS